MIETVVLPLALYGFQDRHINASEGLIMDSLVRCL